MRLKRTATGPPSVPVAAAATETESSGWHNNTGSSLHCQGARPCTDGANFASPRPSPSPELDGILALGALIPLRPNGKSPLVRWTKTKTEIKSPDQISQWRERWPTANWAIVPKADIIVLDIDDARGLAWIRKHGGVPITPITQTARGRHIYLRRPKSLRGELPHVLVKGVEVVKTYALVPPSIHPSGANYEWVVSPREAEPAPCPEWLVKVLKRAARRARRTPRDPRGSEKIPTNVGHGSTRKPEPELRRPLEIPKALSELCNEVVPHAKSSDSNAPIQLAGAIVAHRLDRLRGEELVRAVSAVNARLPKGWRVDAGRIRAICACTERNGYGYSARVLSERTGIPIEKAGLIYALVSRFERPEPTGERLRKSSREVTISLVRAVLAHGLRVGGFVIARATVKRMAEWAGLSPHTVKHRVRAGNWLMTIGRRGHPQRAGTIWAVKLRKLGLGPEKPSDGPYALSKGVIGGEGGAGCGGGVVVVRPSVVSRGPPV